MFTIWRLVAQAVGVLCLGSLSAALIPPSPVQDRLRATAVMPVIPGLSNTFTVSSHTLYSTSHAHFTSPDFSPSFSESRRKEMGRRDSRVGGAQSARCPGPDLCLPFFLLVEIARTPSGQTSEVLLWWPNCIGFGAILFETSVGSQTILTGPSGN